MRSLLFVPGDSERKIEKALNVGADAIIVDLEDSVAPRDKVRAREVASALISARRSDAGSAIYVRVNAFDTGLLDDDLAALMPARPHGIVLPKIVDTADVERLSAKLRVHEAIAGFNDGETAILPIATETAAGVLALPAFVPRSSRLSGLTWGAEDLSAAIGAGRTRDDSGRYTDVFRLARALALLAASAAEIPAIDTVFVDFRDLDGLRDECLAADRDGFTGKLAIHPAQVDIINQAFTPSEAAIEEALAVVAAFSEAGDPGVVAIDGRMFDRPHLRRAERLLARSRTAKLI